MEGRKGKGARDLGGVTSGVGGLCLLGGVPGEDGAKDGALMEVISKRGADVMLAWFPEDCRECVGGVGGKPPILLEACFKVFGLDVSELGREE